MKKSLILLSICSAVLLSSCGTSSYYAYSTFDDGIYYRTSKEDRKNIEADNAEVQNLIEQTRQEAARFSDTILLAGTNGMQSITSAATATAVPLNINIDNYYEYNLLGYDKYCSYWDWKYWDAFGPWGRYSSWYDWYNWYSPWFPGIYDPWYPSWGWSWSFAWNSWGWYGPAGYWWGGYWDPWYYPWGYPVAGHVQPSYYGKRNAGIRTGTAAIAGTGAGRTLASGTTVRRNTAEASRTETRPSISLTRGRTANLTANRTTARLSTGTVTPGRTLTTNNTATGIRTQGSRLNLGEKYAQGNISVSGQTGRKTVTAGTATAIGRSAYRRPAISTEFRNPFESQRTVTGSGSATGYRRATGFDQDRSFEINRNNSFNRNSFNNSSSRTVNSSVSRSVSTRSSAGSVSRSFSGGGARSGGGSARSVRR